MSEITSCDLRYRTELAKLDLEDLLQPTQLITFADSASDQNVTLLQLDKDILECIETGKSLVIRGGEDDSAVLCTEDVTYDIKNASTSNMLVLLGDCITKSSDMKACTKEQVAGEEALSVVKSEAVGWKLNYLEIKKIYPKMSRLIELVNKAPYKGPAENEDETGKMFTLSDLSEIIQASEFELMNWLCKLNCCCIEGYWRVMDFGYIIECMGEILQVVEMESWSCGSVPVEELCEKINDSGELVPSFIVKHLLGCYGTQFTTDDGITCCKFGEEKICRLFAEMLLRDVGKFNLSEFMEVWKGSLPAGILPDNKHLLGLALIDQSSHPSTISLFKVDSLPLNFDERFDRLFQTREKWTLADIEPYIQDLCVKGQTVSSVLTKHARASTLNGDKVFSTRKPLK